MKDFARLELVRPIACGGQSQVYLGQFEGNFRVVKFFRDPLDSAQESACLKRLRHSGIIRLLGSISEQKHAALVLEYVPGSTLRGLLNYFADRRTSLSLKLIAYICQSLLKIIGYIHSQGIIHNDLSPANLLLSTEGEIKLCDFGMALLPWQKCLGPPFGKIEYMAPELLRGEFPSSRSDFYAIGVIIFELVTNISFELGLSKKAELAALRYPYPALYSWVIAALRPMVLLRPRDLPFWAVAKDDVRAGQTELAALVASLPLNPQEKASLALRVIEFIPKNH